MDLNPKFNCPKSKNFCFFGTNIFRMSFTEGPTEKMHC